MIYIIVLVIVIRHVLARVFVHVIEIYIVRVRIYVKNIR